MAAKVLVKLIDGPSGFEVAAALTEQQLENVRRECSLLASISHPNIVQVRGGVGGGVEGGRSGAQRCILDNASASGHWCEVAAKPWLTPTRRLASCSLLSLPSACLPRTNRIAPSPSSCRSSCVPASGPPPL